MFAKLESMDPERLEISNIKLEFGQTRIIEFVGPTGSGKTTNCIQFCRVLKENGITVSTFSDFKKAFYKSGLINQGMVLLRTIFQDGFKLISFARILARNHVLTFDSIKRFFKLSVFNNALIQYTNRKLVDVIILDQWIIQGIWSASIFKNSDFDSLAHSLRHYFFPVDYVFYFDVDVKTASSRIGSRETGRSRFDKMDAETRLRETERFNNYLSGLFETSDCRRKKIFSTLETPEKNASEFLSYFYQCEQNAIRP